MRLFPATAILAATTLPALAAPPQVVVDMPVTGSLVSMVMGDLGAPHVLLPGGADAHDYQLRPSDAAALQGAGLLVWIGPQMTPWLDRAAEQVARGDSLVLLEVEGTHLQDFGAGAAHDHAHDHDGDHGHDHDADHADDHGHDHSGLDPHAWLDPFNAQVWLRAIAGSLSAADPDNAAAYAANADDAAKRIAALDGRIAAQLQPFHDASFAVMHDAYGYFTGHYGLRPAIAVSLGDAASPSAAQIASVRATIAGQGATCIFPEPLTDPRMAALIAEGTDLRARGVMDPEGAGLEPGPGLYPAVLTGLADALAACLGG